MTVMLHSTPKVHSDTWSPSSQTCRVLYWPPETHSGQPSYGGRRAKFRFRAVLIPQMSYLFKDLYVYIGTSLKGPPKR